MRNFSTEAKVGAVAIAAAALLIALSFQVGGYRLGRAGYAIEAEFRTVSGLEDKAKVRLAGVIVGQVNGIYLREGRARVVLRLNDGVKVREDSVVSVASIGILSEFYIDITAGSLDRAVLPPGAVVQGRELLDLNQFIEQMAEVAGEIKNLAARVGEAFGDEDSGLARLIDDADELVRGVNEVVEKNERGVREIVNQVGGLARETRGMIGENREELRGTIANLREFSASLGRHADTLSAQVEKTAVELRGAVAGSREELKALLESLRSASGRADRAAASLESVLGKVDRGEGTLGKLVNSDETVRGVDRAVGRIGDIAAKVDEGKGTIGRLVNDDRLVNSMETSLGSINKYLTKADETKFFLGFRGDYLARAEEMKNAVSIKLQPSPGKYYLLELVDDPAGLRTITRSSTAIDRPEGPYTIGEETVTDEVTRLLFTIQFARSFGDFTFRGGLLESRGGVSLDYDVFRDRLRLTVDGWDFGRELGPRFRIGGRMKVYKDLFLTAGVDDALEDTRRTFFLGAGVLFSDEDLKYLLTLSSGASSFTR